MLEKKEINVYWFRRDLRLEDNIALFESSKLYNPAAVYIYDSDLLRSDDFSNLHNDFIDDSIFELSKSYAEQDSELNVFYAPAIYVFKTLNNAYDIKSVISSHTTDNWITRKRDEKLKHFFFDNGINWKLYQSNGVLMYLKDRNGWSAKWNMQMGKEIIPKPNISKFIKLQFKKEIFSTKNNKIKKFNYEKNLSGGESKAILRLKKFLYDESLDYSNNISSPLTSEKSCSRLSAYLAYGNISIRQIVHATRARQEELRALKVRNGWLKSLSAFSSRLRWHCHFIQKLEMQPNLEFTNMVRAYDALGRELNIDYFEKWKNGYTGYPMIDACMRFLKTKGWINFRMRAMLVSFASYNLWLDWKQTSKYLSKFFTDYEPGIHYNQFQMQSGVTGINAVRIYNPVKQQFDQDPDGYFIRKWCPELVSVPKDYLAHPHLMSQALQKRIGCKIGYSYPNPVVDLKKSTLAAKKIIYDIRNSPVARRQARDVFLMHGSRKRSLRNHKNKIKLRFQ